VDEQPRHEDLPGRHHGLEGQRVGALRDPPADLKKHVPLGSAGFELEAATVTGPRVGLHECLERPVRQRVKDVEGRLGRLTLTAAAAQVDLTGDAWDTVDERLHFLGERAAA
jgi:hypothetical protein